MTRPITQWGDRDEGFKSMFCNSQGREAIMAARAARSDQSTGDKKIGLGGEDYNLELMKMVA
jgi:hypothetical protein